MIKLSDKETGAILGLISEDQLQSLMDALEEESAQDQDYYINRDTLEVFEEQGVDAELLEILKLALGDRDEMEIVWSKA